MKLAELQHFFARAATSGNGPADGLEAVFLSSDGLSASARLAIYNRGYYYRLLDGLGSVFSQTRRLLGAAEFERVGLRYLSEHPSEHPAVEQIGRHFPAFLQELLQSGQPGPGAESTPIEPWLTHVATLEWARLCSLVAPDAAEWATARDIEPSAFPNYRLHFVPSLQLLELDPRALEAFSEAEEKPALVLTAADAPRVGVAVSRPGPVRHESLPRVEYQALLRAHAGRRMHEVCELFDTGHDAQDAPRAFQVIGGWFARRWVSRCSLT